MAAIIPAIGREEFGPRLADLLRVAASLDQITVMSQENDQITPLFAWNRTRANAVRPLVERYAADGSHRFDPTMRALGQSRSQGQHAVLLDDQGLLDDWYREAYYNCIGLEGKFTILDVGCDYRIVQNYYFSDRSGTFSDAEMENLFDLAETVSQCILRHKAICELVKTRLPANGNAGEISKILHRRAPMLTERERQVCSMIVTGHSSEAIALELGIAQSSVATYRKRAYVKLNICSQNQLFMLCLET